MAYAASKKKRPGKSGGSKPKGKKKMKGKKY